MRDPNVPDLEGSRKRWAARRCDLGLRHFRELL
jgi:hypothetical protein